MGVAYGNRRAEPLLPGSILAGSAGMPIYSGISMRTANIAHDNRRIAMNLVKERNHAYDPFKLETIDHEAM